MGKGMKAGKKAKPAQANMQKQMQQMQILQQQMDDLREELDKQEISATAGGGAVTATVNGKHELVGLVIQPDAVDSDDLEMLQDLIIAAVNEGHRQVEELSAREMEKLTGGLGIPGL